MVVWCGGDDDGCCGVVVALVMVESMGERTTRNAEW